MRTILSFLEDDDARATTACERALLLGLGGGCQVPIGAWAQVKNEKLALMAIVGRPDGRELLRECREGSDPERLGQETAQGLLNKGASRILAEVYEKEAG
jgi:hydroxymethylbilane synthase